MKESSHTTAREPDSRDEREPKPKTKKQEAVDWSKIAKSPVDPPSSGQEDESDEPP